MRGTFRRSGGCALLISLTGCTAVLDGSLPSASSGAAGGSAAAGSSAVGGTTSASDCAQQSAPVLHARLLSPSQYDHAALDLLKVDGHPAKDFGGGVAARFDEVAVEQRADSAATSALAGLTG